YAILSHVWQDVEQSFYEMAALEDAHATVDDPRVSIKARECCRLAQTYGLPWVWIDAPCIDKRNSAELSEAIRSMHGWYAKASICFAYLADVERPADPDLIRAPKSAFRGSAYFRRAWTLQELLAPRRVVFLYADWSVLGEKHDLADVLEETTGIDRDVLTFHRPLSAFSVAHRLSWGSGRDARRPEDKAYCLMGLFDIHMSIRYGEGEMAFCRLQQEILQKICDHTLLTW
ncbi:HET-domain-containing protein, partial [Trametes versicolor FP-101664 SS1]|uniref:HET-domain-containing protein n=1 Tax=Trametes versicolor (strain FP-101664) TaxID=717944 RepID=UPI0004623E40